MSKFVSDLKLNIQSNSWWIGLISGGILIGKAFGYDITKYIGVDWQNTLNILVTLGVLHGVSANTKIDNTEVNSNEIVQTTSQTENISSINVNTINTSNTSNTKVTPINPDNIKEHEQEVSGITSSTPN